MMIRLKRHPFSKPTDSYLSLIRKFPLRPLTTEADYDIAASIIASLAVRGEDDLDQGERQYLDVLEILIEPFDDDRRPRANDKRSKSQRLKALLTEARVSQKQLAEMLELSEPMISLVLAGKRELSPASLRRLSNHFHVSADYFL